MAKTKGALEYQESDQYLFAGDSEIGFDSETGKSEARMKRIIAWKHTINRWKKFTLIKEKDH